MRVLKNLAHPSSWMTLVGLLVALLGMAGSLRVALICLVIAGLCDLADGPIARRMTRTAGQQQFGVHLDSLVDVVSFLVLPVTIAARLLAGHGAPAPVMFVVAPLYLIAGIARLASFTAGADPTTPSSHYSGLPVTYAALVLPVLATGLLLLGLPRLGLWWLVAMALLAVLFVAPIRIPKPRGKAHLVFGLLALAVLITLASVPM